MNDERPAVAPAPRGLDRWLPGLGAMRAYPRDAFAGPADLAGDVLWLES